MAGRQPSTRPLTFRGRSVAPAAKAGAGAPSVLGCQASLEPNLATVAVNPTAG